MQLFINQPSKLVSGTIFKPFLLFGTATVSSVALYTPLSSQTKELREKFSNNSIKFLSPFSFLKNITKGFRKII